MVKQLIIQMMYQTLASGRGFVLNIELKIEFDHTWILKYLIISPYFFN